MIRTLLAVLAACVLAGCSSFDVDSDHDTTVDFTRFRTWDWRPGPHRGAPSAAVRDSLLDRRVRPAVERHLRARGFDRDPDAPDFVVAYQVGLQGKLYITTWDHGRRRRVWGGSTTRVTHYDEGSLVLAVVDAESNEIVWRGTARTIVGDGGSASLRDAQVDEAVRLILERFPPGRP